MMKSIVTAMALTVAATSAMADIGLECTGDDNSLFDVSITDTSMWVTRMDPTRKDFLGHPLKYDGAIFENKVGRNSFSQFKSSSAAFQGISSEVSIDLNFGNVFADQYVVFLNRYTGQLSYEFSRLGSKIEITAECEVSKPSEAKF